ncbi:MAG: glycosyltransferase [Bacteroidia bacterium]|nr:glycosyltransferase [Bacteroidia bacterium]
MIVVQIIILVIYSLSLLFIFLFTLSQAHLVWVYVQSKNIRTIPEKSLVLTVFPEVTVQLPVYNEMYVIERLIDAVCQLNYPKNKLQIQVLDDSTDDSVLITAKKIKQWQLNGINILHVQRVDRSGFKAGALKAGLESATGEFIAIFDADFIPDKDFLTLTLPYFITERVGLVQTRWGHINRDFSILTELQAFALDTHFSIEQVGRNLIGSFINFNGTGGIWRKATIVDSGNWQSDTLTEDLDLSYRAQLKGWKFRYLEDVVSPAELPPLMSALKSQQFRWTKGGAETARKHIRTLLKSDHPIHIKIHGAMHLLNSTIFVAVLLCALLSVPLLAIKNDYPQLKFLFYIASFFLFSFLIIGVQYYISSSSNQEKPLFKKVTSFLFRFPLFLSFSMGLSLHNTIAVMEGFANKKTAFIRTPKFNMLKNSAIKNENKYIVSGIPPHTFIEGILALYFSFGIYQDVQYFDYTLLLFHLFLFTGFTAVFYFSVRHSFIGFRKKSI